MKISDVIKAKIQDEYNAWQAEQYAGKDKKERQALGAFFTPPPLTIKMLEKFDSIKDKDILDPTCGAGGLLAATIIAGADPKRIYGIELDPEIRKVCVRRLVKLGVPPKHIKLGNALNSDVYDDFEDYGWQEEDLAEEQTAEVHVETSRSKKHSSNRVASAKQSNRKPASRKIEHDQNAVFMKLEKIYNNENVIVTELKFPDIAMKTTSFSITDKGKIKKSAMDKLMNFVDNLIANGNWLLKDVDFDNIEMKYMLNDIAFKLDADKILDVKVADVKSIAMKQMFDSFDDFKQLLS